MRLTSVLSVALVLLGARSSRAEEPAPIQEPAPTQEPTPPDGYHSIRFDAQKYQLLDQLLITPKTHPNLFSFTGRWLHTPPGHPHSPAFQATLWPGNSVTVLLFGEKASIKLLPKPQGRIEHYTFVVSIDGGPDVRYNTDGFDTSAGSREPHYIPIDFGAAEGDHKDKRVTQLRPHTLRITSIAATPFSFEGIMVENSQIRQGYAWQEAQARHPIIEFIGEGIDAERPGGFFRADKYVPPAKEQVESPIDAIFSTVHYKLAEYLGVRHVHYSAGACITSECDSRKLPGLGEQYFYTSPLNFSGHTLDISQKSDPRHIDNLRTPWRFPGFQVRTDAPTLVVVDAGILDVLMTNQQPSNYSRVLSLFLVRLRSQAHPKTKILVIAHRGAPHRDSTIIKPNFETASMRLALYTATQRAVTALRDSGIIFTPVHLGGDPQEAYLRAMCPHLLAPSGVVAKTRSAVFGKAPKTEAQRICAEVVAANEGHGSKLFAFLVVFGMCATGLWVARTTVVGAVAAVVGRRRLGMLDEEEGRLLEGHGR